MSSVYETLAVRQDGAVLHLTLNRPQVRNAISMTMVGELRAALAGAVSRGDTRIVVLRGAGGHFCAGADLKDMQAAWARLNETGPRGLRDMNAQFGQLCAEFARAPLATVAVLEGAVMGGGFGLACVVDVALAGRDVSFRLPETSLGVVPAQIAPFLVERIGISEARRLAVTGGEIGADAALAMRLVHEVHDNAALDAALARVLDQALRCAPKAVALTKDLLAKARFVAPQALIDEAAEAFAQSTLGAEGLEGIAAFMQKRKPKWMP